MNPKLRSALFGVGVSCGIAAVVALLPEVLPEIDTSLLYMGYGFVGLPLYLILLVLMPLVPKSLFAAMGLGLYGLLFVLSMASSFITIALLGAWAHHRWLRSRWPAAG